MSWHRATAAALPQEFFFSSGGAERHTHLPGVVQLIRAHEVGVIALESVEDERLVRLRDLWVRESPLVRQVHLGWYRAHPQTGLLGVQLQVHGLGGLNAQDKLVAPDVTENARGCILELNPHFHLSVVQGFKSQTRRKSTSSAITTTGKLILPFPALRMKGTPSQRGLLTHSVVAAKVGHVECAGTVSSSR